MSVSNQLPVFSDATAAVQWLQSVAGKKAKLQSDSRKVQAGEAFVGSQPTENVAKNVQYAQDALQKGAVAVLLDASVQAFEDSGLMGQPVALVENLKEQAGAIASAYMQEPSARLHVCAFTGTNGKTSSAWWLSQALAHVPAAYVEQLPEALTRCGVIGTLGVGSTQHIEHSGYTTPEPVLLHKALHEMAESGYGVCALEASSIGIAEHRLNATHIHTAVFTNFTQDHLDYHGDMQAYWQAKQCLFAWQGLRVAVINWDEKKAGELMDFCASDAAEPDLDVWTYSVRDKSARLYARNVLTESDGLSFDVVEGVHSKHVRVPVVGMHNVSNLLGVIATMRTLGVPFIAAVQACAHISAVPGRMDAVHGGEGQPLVVVDFAHTPDAIGKALQALRPLCDKRGGKLWCVVGCGGNRDASKRPLMAAVAERDCDALVLTSDNPRNEDPEAIVQSMVEGLYHPDQAQVVVDRADAIAQTVLQAASVDVLLLAGKGHEAYQEIAGEKIPFSDHAHAQAALQKRAEKAAANPVGNADGNADRKAGLQNGGHGNAEGAQV